MTFNEITIYNISNCIYNDYNIQISSMERAIYMTVLVDHEINNLAQNNDLIEHYNESCLTNIGYDLRADIFTDGNKSVKEISLQPGESTFVQTIESIKLPTNFIARVSLKNSRIRQGFTLDSPIYQPGHHTKVFFRLTNISNKVLILKSNEKYAMISFEELEQNPNTPYQGTFQEEMDFNDLGSYQGIYQQQMKEIEEKKDDIKSIEQTIYSNVLVILTVFVALFTFLTSNISLFSAESSIQNFLIYNFMMLGCISTLVLLLSTLFTKINVWRTIIYCILIALFFVASFYIFYSYK